MRVRDPSSRSSEIESFVSNPPVDRFDARKRNPDHARSQCVSRWSSSAGAARHARREAWEAGRRKVMAIAEIFHRLREPVRSRRIAPGIYRNR